MSDSDGRQSFWATLPGILTGAAALITAVTTLYLALHKEAPTRKEPPKIVSPGGAPSPTPSASPTARPTVGGRINLPNIETIPIPSFRIALTRRNGILYGPGDLPVCPRPPSLPPGSCFALPRELRSRYHN